MAKVRDILIDVKIEQAQCQRKCRRNSSHVIAKGEWCLVVRTNATNDDYSYSRGAAKPMLDAAWAKAEGSLRGLGDFTAWELRRGNERRIQLSAVQDCNLGAEPGHRLGSGQKKWRLVEISEADESETCLCGHFPIIELCTIANTTTGKSVDFGNVCVKRFLGFRSDLIFQSLKRVRADLGKAIGPQRDCVLSRTRGH